MSCQGCGAMNSVIHYCQVWKLVGTLEKRCLYFAKANIHTPYNPAKLSLGINVRKLCLCEHVLHKTHHPMITLTAGGLKTTNKIMPSMYE